MATGSGKTKVMSLLIAWQYFNAVAEGRDDYARSFLLLAPNVIVFERLRADFEGGRIFRLDPIIPQELSIFWDFDCYMRGDPERASSQGALYLTNIQQFYERAGNGSSDEPDEMTEVLGSAPRSELTEVEDFDERIIKRGAPCLVINDEGHHTHDEDSEWNQVIRRLNESLGAVKGSARLLGNASLRQGRTVHLDDLRLPAEASDHRQRCKAADEGPDGGHQGSALRHRKRQVPGLPHCRCRAMEGVPRPSAPLGKKPILFVMLNSTAEADDVGDYLRVTYPEDFGSTAGGKSQLLVIHTDRSGEVSKKDLDAARMSLAESMSPRVRSTQSSVS